jgi:hypothetical protein
MKARLDAVARRLNQLAMLPPRRRPGLARRLLRRLHRSPRIDTGHTRWLVKKLSGEVKASLPGQRVPPYLLLDAVKELERGVRKVERAARRTGRVPAAQLQWLWRLYQILYRAQQLMTEPKGAWQDRLQMAGVGPHLLRPLQTARGTGPPDRRSAAVDALLDAAHDEVRRLGRKRRLLEAARQFLLDAAAASPLNAEAVRDRRVHIAKELAQLDRLQAAGLSPDVDLLYQARQAHGRGDRPRLIAALSAIEAGAIEGGRPQLARLANRALDHAWDGTGHSRFSEQARTASTALSHAQLTSPWARQRIQAGYRRARASVPELRAAWGDQIDDAFAAKLEQYSGRDALAMTVSATVAADGCFELGGTVSPVQVVETQHRLIEVRHPTEDLALAPARTVADIPDAVVDDPRTVLTSLATGTLLARRYQATETRQTTRRGLMNDARLYVLDGSGSMVGARSRMRDALLVAELSTLVARLSDPGRTGNPVVYYAYFNDKMGEFRRVATAAEAQEAIEEVIGTIRLGGTDIQAALLASLDHLRLARQSDPSLQRAQLVLVTDGEAAVDLPAVEDARAKLGDLPIGVSIIALGQENEALRQLAAQQRARGERVFYQFMDDRELEDVEHGRRDGLPIHLPAEQGPAALAREIDSVIEEMAQQLRPLEAVEIDQASVLDQAMSEVGLSLDDRGAEGLRSRREALMKDQATLQARFQRWFPPPGRAPVPLPPPEDDAGDLSRVTEILQSVAEVVSVGSAHPLERRSDAIEIAERLLHESAIGPWRYADLVRRHPGRCQPAIEAVHAAVGALSR